MASREINRSRYSHTASTHSRHHRHAHAHHNQSAEQRPAASENIVEEKPYQGVNIAFQNILPSSGQSGNSAVTQPSIMESTSAWYGIESADEALIRRVGYLSVLHEGHSNPSSYLQQQINDNSIRGTLPSFVSGYPQTVDDHDLDDQDPSPTYCHRQMQQYPSTGPGIRAAPGYSHDIPLDDPLRPLRSAPSYSDLPELPVLGLRESFGPDAAGYRHDFRYRGHGNHNDDDSATVDLVPPDSYTSSPHGSLEALNGSDMCVFHLLSYMIYC